MAEGGNIPIPLRRRTDISTTSMLEQLEREVSGQPAPKLPHIAIEEKDIGRLSAEAVLSQFDSASEAVKTLGEEVKDRIRKLESALKEADGDLKLVTEAALAIKEKGKLVHTQIEEASLLSKEIRETCSLFHKKVSTTTPSEDSLP